MCTSCGASLWFGYTYRKIQGIVMIVVIEEGHSNPGEIISKGVESPVSVVTVGQYGRQQTMGSHDYSACRSKREYLAMTPGLHLSLSD